ncbi:MAG: ABC transporter ATP-binding protein [Eubacterium sp.]|nr:ABC transporter ATP-binding protein [Eubacterium sp.]
MGDYANSDVVIGFDHVTKTYKLFENDKQRFRAIFFKNIKYKKKNAINDVTFQIKKGESVALLGRNGAGKSTLLKMITGVAYPTVGDIVVNGRVSALLELSAGFDKEFTGRENIYFRAQLLGMKKSEIDAKMDDIIEFADIGDYMDQPLRTYSSGMRARLGFAINVNVDPEILIVDEALSVGDVSFRRKCTEKINDLLSEQGITFLLVTHSTNAALDFCERGIVMKKGKIKFDGDIQEATDFYKEMIEKEDAKKKKKKKKKRKKMLEEQRLREEAEKLAAEGNSAAETTVQDADAKTAEEQTVPEAEVIQAEEPKTDNGGKSE